MSKKVMELEILDRSLKGGLIFMFLLLLVSVVAYLSVFNEGLSQAPDNWAAFGSFFGGLIGPAVSLVTLLAVLKTVYLQKELLDTQRSEFSAMQRLQQATFDSQSKQISAAAAMSERDYFDRVRVSCLQMIDRQLLAHENKLDRVDSAIKLAAQLAYEGKRIRPEDIDGMKESHVLIAKVITDLTQLSVRISQDEYASAADLQEHYRGEMVKVFLGQYGDSQQ